jgi:hypothetical protein
MSDRPYRVYRGGQGGSSQDDPDLQLPRAGADASGAVVDPPAERVRPGPIVLPAQDGAKGAGGKPPAPPRASAPRLPSESTSTKKTMTPP